MYYKIAVEQSLDRLKALKTLLEKVESQSKEKNMSESDLLALALTPDMFPLLKQIQIVTDVSKWAIGRLTQKDIPVFEDDETTLSELYKRLDTTIELLGTCSESDFENTENKKIEMSYFPGMHFTAEWYLLSFLVPNLNFHTTTAYAICRANGFEIGKQDYIWDIPLIPNS